MFILEAGLKIIALGAKTYFKNRYVPLKTKQGHSIICSVVIIYSIPIITNCFVLISRWNCLDMLIVVLSVAGIILDELATSNFPMNPTIIRVMRVLRITRGKITGTILGG